MSDTVSLAQRAFGDDVYTIERLIGEGGMGAVYEARHRVMDRPVALKVLHPAALENDAAIARFQREMRISARLEHPNTVRVYDFGSIDERCYLAMELLRGRSLRQVLQEDGPFEIERIVRVGTQIARALAAAQPRHPASSPRRCCPAATSCATCCAAGRSSRASRSK